MIKIKEKKKTKKQKPVYTLKIKYMIGDGLGDLVQAETEYSFLVYQDYELKYHDENGIKHNTYFE